MAGSKKSALVYVIAAIMFIVQMVLSLVAFNDTNGALLGIAFVVIMSIGAAVAWKGGLSQVVEQTADYEIGGHTRVREYRDTGQSVQCSPCFGICGGVAAIIVVLMLGIDILGTELFLFLIPGILGGILGIVAAIIFVFEYKGPWMLQRF
jgi:hypothetical protein